MRHTHTFLAVAALLWCSAGAVAADGSRQPAKDVSISGIELGDRLKAGPLLNDAPQASKIDPDEHRAEPLQERTNRKVRIVYPF